MASKRMDYFKLPGFENIVLEESYLLDIEEDDSEVRFQLEIVLTENHAAYSSPQLGEQYSYHRGEIVFSNVLKKTWIEKIMRPIPDPSGEPDFGNIDSFSRIGEEYHLAGEWGEIKILSTPPILRLQSN